MKGYLRNAICGVFIGFGAVLPGVSGGVMAVCFALYTPMLDAISTIFKDFKKNFVFLLPIGIGAAIGVVLGSVLIKLALEKYMATVMYLFLGMVAGGLPSLIKQANEGGFRKGYIIAGLIGVGVASLLAIFDRAATQGALNGTLGIVQYLISGAVIAFGSIIPGISTSFILMYLGWYEGVLAAIAAFDMVALLCVGAGALVCAVLIIKLARWLFTHYSGYAYWVVIGILCVSAVLVFPGFRTQWVQVLDILLFAGGFAGAYYLNKAFAH